MLQDQDIRKPSIHNQGMTWVTDYLIGCHNSTQPGSSGLGVFVGSNE
jgi:WD repeat-containing protein 89